MAALTYTQLRDLFHGVTVSMTGLDPQFIRHAYQPESIPAWDKGQNVVIINLAETQDQYNQQRHLQYREGGDTTTEESTAYTRVITVDWMVYGPQARDIAEQIRYAIHTYDIRAPLSQSQVYPLPGTGTPVTAPFEFNNQWWERVDVSVPFNAYTVHTGEIPIFSGGAIEIEDSDGPERVISI